MSLIKSYLCCTTMLAAFAVIAPNPVYAGSGTITYDMQYQSQFGGSGSTDGLFNFPEQIALGPDNKLYIADRNNNRIQIFNQNGGYDSQFGSGGTGPGLFNNTSGIAFTQNGNILATDMFNNRVQIFDRITHSQIGEFGTPGNGQGQFNIASYLATDSRGNIYVTDYGNNRIVVFDQNGIRVNEINTGGSPVGIAIDSNDKIYVSSEANSEVLMYDSSYNFKGALALFGNGPGQLAAPSGIAVDAQDNIYIANSANNRIEVFKSDGTFLFSYDNSAAAPGQFDRPRGIFVNDTGKIYVGEVNTNKINILQMISTETFAIAPTGGNETATTLLMPLSNLVLNGAGGSYAANFIGYNNVSIGGGNWTLSGTHNFSGDAELNSGMLQNNGTIQALSFSVDNGALLAGTGTFNTGVLNSGTISPGTNGGNDIGTINVSNYIDNVQSTYRIDVNASGASDKIVSADFINLNNGALDIYAANGSYAYQTNYTIMTAINAVNGTFGTITSNLAFLDPTIDYSDPHAIILSMIRNDISPPAGGLDFMPFAYNDNQQSTAVALTDYSTSQFGGNTAIFNQLQGFNQVEASEILSQISPDEIASMPQIQYSLLRNMQTSLFQRLDALPEPDHYGFAFLSPGTESFFAPSQVWLQTLGGVNNQDSTSNGAAGYRLGIVGIRGGADKDIDSKTTLGLSVAYAHGTADYKDSNDKSETQYTHLDVYGRHIITEDGVILEGFAGAGGGRIDTTRRITAGGLNLAARGNTNAYDISGALRASMPAKITPADTIIPSITGNIAWTRQNAFSENGAAPFNLGMNSITATPVTITPMINLQHRFQNEKYGYEIIPDIGVGATWQLTELNSNVNARFSNAVNVPGFTVSGAKQSPFSLNLTAAVTVQPYTDNKYVPLLVVQTTMQTSDKFINSAATLTAKWNW